MNLETRESESACIVLSDLYRNVFVRPREVPPPCEGAPVDVTPRRIGGAPFLTKWCVHFRILFGCGLRKT